ncbi:MAG: hypothetical protein AAF530_23860 [Pseudomonadota bacterium]
MSVADLDPGLLGQAGKGFDRPLPGPLAGPLALPVEEALGEETVDRLTLSPAAQQAVGEGGDAAAGPGGLPAEAEQFIFDALNSLRDDLSRLLQGFGITGDAQKSLSDAFVGPALAALQSGVDFSADLSLSAFSQVTRISGSSFSQVTDLVTRSLEIDVNRTTGEVSVSLASLSVHQEVHRGGGAAPLLAVGPGILDRPASDVSQEETPLEQLLREASETLVEQVRDFISDIAVTAIENYQDAAGHQHTKFILDAVTPLGDGAQVVEEETTPLDLDA